MGIASLLTHRVALVRRGPALDGAGQEILDDYGHAVLVETETPGLAVAIQPRSATEMAASHQAGAEIATHRIYALDRSITAADALIHDPATCPVAADLPAGRYELSSSADAAGVGHHLELDAVLVRPKDLAPPGDTGGPGSGSGSGSGS